MQIAVVGGTGALGARVVAELTARGDEVRVLSRRPPAEVAPGASHRVVDLLGGEGLEEGLDGIEAVVDASNSRRRAEDLLVEGNARLLEAEREAGVRHHVGISIVGCDRVPLSYYEVKVRQEATIAAGPVPWSLLRATQFHSLVAGLFASAARRRILPTGAARLQPIDPAEVARRMADAAHAEPAGMLPEAAGPQILTLTELARAWREADPKALLRLRLPMIGRAGHALRDGALCNPAAATPGRSFPEWLAERG